MAALQRACWTYSCVTKRVGRGQPGPILRTISSRQASVPDISAGAIQEAGSNSLATYLLKPWRPGARGNIFLNQDRESKFKYIEVNKSEIRLEFQDTDSSIYQYYIERWTERSEYGTVKPSMDSISESSDIRDLVIDVRNNTFCGAGATVLLCKQGFISFLKRNLNMPHLEEVSQLS